MADETLEFTISDDCIEVTVCDETITSSVDDTLQFDIVDETISSPIVEETIESSIDETLEFTLNEVLVSVQGGESYRKVAGESIGGHRVVIVGTGGKVFYADNTNLDHSTILFGLTIQSVILDEVVIVRASGEINEPSWSWTLNMPIFLSGTTGQLSQTEPLTGFSQIIGFPTTVTSMVIKIDRPIILL